MSNIDPSNPTQGQATTQSVRDNFQAAADEIDANAAAIAVLEPGGGGDFASFLAGYKNDGGLAPSETGDADTFTVNGMYSVGDTVTNLPADYVGNQGGMLEVIAHNTLRQVQILYGRDTVNTWKQWMRSNDSGAWGAWKLVVDGGAFALRLAGYLDTGLHAIYAGDLNDINVNSFYAITGTDVTNDPADFVQSATGFIRTDTVFGGNWSTQTLYGLNDLNRYRIWMRSEEGANIWGAWKLVVDGNILTFAPTTANMVLPTSAAGLSAGDLWNNLGVVNIV